MEGIADWSYSNFFADLVKQSRGFGPPQSPWSGTVAVDANGWPTEDFGVILATWPTMKNVGGDYKISLWCATTPTIGLVASPGQIENESRNAATGIVTADLIYPENGGQLMLSFTNTNGGVKNLQVMRPGYSAPANPSTNLFTTPILTQLQNFSTLRFMDWDGTNGNTTVTWAQRTPPTAPSYAGGNVVPWEACIDLCNQTGKDAWINVPAEADDEYVTNLAHLFHAQLNPGLHLYVEYSNEVWNWGFPQATWNLNQASADVAAGDPDLNFDNCNNQYTWCARRIAKRIKTISGQFKTEYGSSFATTVRPVLATQVEWPGYWLVDGLTFLNARYGPPSNYLYACAGAPYFNLGNANNLTTLTTTQVLAALSNSVTALNTDLNVEACETMSRYNNLKFIGYEGGPDTFGPNDIAAKEAASMDPRMQPIVQTYLNTWLGYGAGLINWFSGGASNYYSQYGTWGITDDMADTNSPKLLGVQAVEAANTVTLTQGSACPGSVHPMQYCMRDANWRNEGMPTLSPTDWRGPSRDYLLRTTATGTRKLFLLTATTDPTVSLNIYLNNQKIGVIKVPATSSSSSFAKTPVLNVPMTTGMNTLRVEIGTGSACAVDSIIIN
jgi:hypothetical protein